MRQIISVNTLLLIGRILSVSCWIPSKRSCRNRIKLFTTREQSTITLTATNFTIPRAFDGEIDEGTYPSPLHFVHVESILSDEEVSICLDLANEHATTTGAWQQPDQERHETYSTCDFPVEQCERLLAYMTKIGFDERIWDKLTSLYGVEYESLSYLDLFCASYQPRSAENPNVMDQLELHRDGSLLSFTITLSGPDQFEGGGTKFDAFRDVRPSEDGVLSNGGVIRPSRAGDAVFHCGKLLHGADVVHSGKRVVLVGFVDVADWYHRPGVISSSCRDWGRMDVAKLRYERQVAKTKNGENGWLLNNERWITSGEYDQSNTRSKISGFCPAFRSVERRVQPEFQRRTRLEAEDRLLRSILLGKDDVTGFEFFGGDITIE
jgi:hypothetical protein